MLKCRYAIVLLVLLVVSVSVLTGCKPAGLVSTSQEVDIGRQASKQVESQYPVNKDPELNRMVTTMGQNLVRFSPRQDVEYTFKILDVDEVNAVSLPGGWIYVYKGLIDLAENNPDQLAGVMAHEIGHVAARHHADMIGRETYAGLIIQTVTRGDVQQWAGLFANLTLLRWSRKHEYEADILGIDIMYKSKQYDPQGLINFFGALEQKQKDNPSEFAQMFRTHPVTTERIKRAQEHLADLKAGRAQPK